MPSYAQLLRDSRKLSKANNIPLNIARAQLAATLRYPNWHQLEMEAKRADAQKASERIRQSVLPAPSGKLGDIFDRYRNGDLDRAYERLSEMSPSSEDEAMWVPHLGSCILAELSDLARIYASDRSPFYQSPGEARDREYRFLHDLDLVLSAGQSDYNQDAVFVRSMVRARWACRRAWLDFEQQTVDLDLGRDPRPAIYDDRPQATSVLRMRDCILRNAYLGIGAFQKPPPLADLNDSAALLADAYSDLLEMRCRAVFDPEAGEGYVDENLAALDDLFEAAEWAMKAGNFAKAQRRLRRPNEWVRVVGMREVASRGKAFRRRHPDAHERFPAIFPAPRKGKPA